jgi:hypothetical protein
VGVRPARGRVRARVRGRVRVRVRIRVRVRVRVSYQPFPNQVRGGPVAADVVPEDEV